MLKHSLVTSFFFLSVIAYANVGIFGGFGHSVILEKTSDIQMVSEEVSISLGRGMIPFTGSLRGLDRAEYRCKFLLRNLSDKKVTVQVGFPLSSGDNYMISAAENPSAFDIIARHNFIAGTDKKMYPVRYVRHDKAKKFRQIFLWNMTFEPKQEITLKVFYALTGYQGLGTTKRRPYNWKPYKYDYLDFLDRGIGESFGYVTETGKSWKGPIEKAVFKVYLDDFEKYLAKRGMTEYESQKDKKRASARLPVNYGQIFREISPKGWKEVKERRQTYIVWEFKNFKPGPEILINYVYTQIPRNTKDFKLLLETIEKRYCQERQRRLKSKKLKGKIPLEFNAAAKKNVADVILEYYGVNTGNKKIGGFLKDQAWYPPRNPPRLDKDLKSVLLKYSK